ncbi:MAG: hypothetical protein FWF44_09860 [Defluviitaleaceae bacterium]|nr:hypothetical protein [Defluviitaleaceae bacterium]
MSYLVEFDKIPWDEPAKGLRLKVYKNGEQQIRLIEFSGGYVEPDWCYHRHMGYVLDGGFSIDCNGKLERYEKGDVLLIPEGEQAKHMPVLGDGEKVLLLLFEADT